MLTSAITRDVDTGVTTVFPQGALTLSTAPGLRTVLRKTSAECPTAVLVNLANLERIAPGLGSLFAAASRHTAQTWGVPLLLYGPHDGLAGELASFPLFNHVYPSRWSALNAVRTWVPRWWHARLAPTPASPTRARHLVADILHGWALPHLVEPTWLIVAELAGNAVEHAAMGDFDLTVSYTGRYVRIGVQDRSPLLPHILAHPEPGSTARPNMRGWGLRIVANTATHWGTTVLPEGKIVYALLKTDAVPTRDD